MFRAVEHAVYMSAEEYEGTSWSWVATLVAEQSVTSNNLFWPLLGLTIGETQTDQSADHVNPEHLMIVLAIFQIALVANKHSTLFYLKSA